jgi:hypothetical protein
MFCEVPSGGDVVGEGRPGADLPGESQIAKFGDVIIDEEIFRLHVSMEEAVLVHIGESAGDLVDYVPAFKQKYFISFSVNFLFSSFIFE